MSRTATVKFGNFYSNLAVLLGKFLSCALLVCLFSPNGWADINQTVPDQPLDYSDINANLTIDNAHGWNLGNYHYERASITNPTGGHLYLETNGVGSMVINDNQTLTFTSDTVNFERGNGGAIYINRGGNYSFNARPGTNQGTGYLHFTNNQAFGGSGGAIYIVDSELILDGTSGNSSNDTGYSNHWYIVNPDYVDNQNNAADPRNPYVGTEHIYDDINDPFNPTDPYYPTDPANNGEWVLVQPETPPAAPATGYADVARVPAFPSVAGYSGYPGYPGVSGFPGIKGLIEDVATHDVASIIFEGNRAVGNGVNAPTRGGGAIYNDISTITLNNVRFGDGTDASANYTTMSGGAIYNNDGLITFDAASGVNGARATTSTNTSGTGGWGGVATSTSQTYFNRNIAEEYGGAIYNSSGGTLVFNAGATATASVTRSESTAGRGSQYTIINGGTFAVANSGFFRDNYAALHGGAIFNDRGILNFTAETAASTATLTLTANPNAPVNYAIIESQNGGMTVNATANGGVFIGNTAGRYGGAIYYRPNADVLNFNATAGSATATATANATNTGAQGTLGAAESVVSDTTSANAGVFVNNRANSGRGGALYNEGGSVEFAASAVNATANATANGTTTGAIPPYSVVSARAQATAASNANAGTFTDNVAGDGVGGTSTTDRGGAVFNEGGTMNFSAQAAAAVANAEATASANPPGNGTGTAHAIASATALAYATGADFVENEADFGGAIFNGVRRDSQGRILSVGNLTFRAAAAVTATADIDATSTSNHGIASAFTVSSATAKAIGASFLENKAVDGGALFNEGGNATFETTGAASTTSNITYAVDINGANVPPNQVPGANPLLPTQQNTIYQETVAGQNNGVDYGLFFGPQGGIGGDYVYGRAVAVSDVAAGLFTRNTATNNGGAIFNASLYDANNNLLRRGSLAFNGTSRFVENAAQQYGGAIFNDTSSTLRLTSNATGYTTFTKNGLWGTFTTQYGGAIYNNSAEVVDGNGTSVGGFVMEGTSTLGRNGYFWRNVAENGGAIFNAENATMRLSDVDFRENVAQRVGTFGGYGGAIYNNNGDISLHGGEYRTNEADVSGGAIYFNVAQASAGKMLTLDGSTYEFIFDDNDANNYGGAIFNTQYGVINVMEVRFEHNAATLGGGAIYNEGQGIIAQSIFGVNTDSVGTDPGDGKGGALYNKIIAGTAGSGNLALVGNTFHQNEVDATDPNAVGGAIYNEGGVIGSYTDEEGVVHTSSDNVFTQNQAYSGGAIYTSGGTIDLTGGRFQTNEAEMHGGAVYNDGGTLSFTDVDFLDNITRDQTPGKHGAAIYTTNGTVNLAVSQGSTAEFRNNKRDYDGQADGTYDYESIYFAAGNNTLNVYTAEGANLNMYDPMHWATGATVNIVKDASPELDANGLPIHEGTGTWLLAGKNSFWDDAGPTTNDPTGTINFDIRTGMLYLHTYDDDGVVGPNPAISASLDLGNGNFHAARGAALKVDGAALADPLALDNIHSVADLASLTATSSSITTTSGDIALDAGSVLVFDNLTEIDYIRSDRALGNMAVLSLNNQGSDAVVGSDIEVYLSSTLDFMNNTTQAMTPDGVVDVNWREFFTNNGELRLFDGAVPGINTVTYIEFNPGVVYSDIRLSDGTAKDFVVENGYLKFSDTPEDKTEMDLHWTGAVNNRWNTTDQNWYGENGTTIADTFINAGLVVNGVEKGGDNVIFADTYRKPLSSPTETTVSQKQIVLDNSVTVGSMNVTGTGYIFSLGANQTITAENSGTNANANAGSINLGSATVNMGIGSGIIADNSISLGAGSSLVINGNNTISGSTLNFDVNSNFVFNMASATSPVLTVDGTVTGAAGRGSIDIRGLTPPAGNTSIVLIDTDAAGYVTDTGTLYINGAIAPPTRGQGGGWMTGLGLSEDQTDLLLVTVENNGSASDLYWKGGIGTGGSDWNESAAHWSGTVSGIRVRTFLNGDDVHFADMVDGLPVTTKTVAPTIDVEVGSMTVEGSDFVFDLTNGNITATSDADSTGNINFGNGTRIISDVDTAVSSNGGSISFGQGTQFEFNLSNIDPNDTLLSLTGNVLVSGEAIGAGDIYLTDVDNLQAGESIALVNTNGNDGTTASNGRLIIDGVEYTVPERSSVAGATMYALATDVTNSQLLLKWVDAGQNTGLTWTGAETTMNNGLPYYIWGNSDGTALYANWQGQVEGVNVTTFLNGDTVLFDNTATNKYVTLAEGGVSVDSMTVASTGYTFDLENGGIYAENDIDLLDSTIVVHIQEVPTTEALEVANRIVADGTITISGTKFQVDARGIDPEFFRQTTRFEVLVAGEGIEQGVQLFSKEVDVAMDNPLYVGEFFVEASTGFLQLGLYDFTDKFTLNHNTREAANALNVLRYARWGDTQFQTIMEDPYGAIHQLRGTEIVADALNFALWSPWEITHRRMRTTRDDTGWNTWGEAYYRTGHTSKDDNAVSYDFARGGTMVGADFGANRYWHIGGTFGYGLPKVENTFGQVDGTDLTLGLYSKINFFDQAAVTSFFGYGYQSYDIERRDFAGMHRGDFDGDALYASVEFARPIQSQWGLILPLVALDHQTAWTKRFTESGPWGQSVAGASMDRTMVRFGVDGQWVPLGMFDLMTRFQGAFLLEGDDYATVRSHIPGSTASMALRGVDVGMFQVNAGISASGEYRQRYHWFMDLDGYFAGRSYAVQGQIGLSTRW